MVSPDYSNGSSVQRRTAEYEPPRSWRTWLIGRPLPTADAPHQTVGKLIGLAIFASDALSSTAYATQEILLVLAVAGTMAFGAVFPISIAIVALLAIVTLSYEQTIHAYPNGGGAYIVARDNLGELAARTAGAALLTDYVLTVAVSVSSGVAQIVSAFPTLFEKRMQISVVLVLFVMVINLRGVRESGRLFAIPTYFFILTMYATVGVGLFHYLMGSLGTVPNPPPPGALGNLRTLTPFLILHVADHPDTSAQAWRLGAVLKEAGIPARVFGAKETNHNKLNADLGLPGDPATEALYQFLNEALKSPKS